MPSPTAAIITLKTRKIDTMNAIYLGPEVLVESECNPGTWYVVNGSACSCPGNTYHGHCKHVAVAQTAAEIDRRESVAVLPEPSDTLKESWLGEPLRCAWETCEARCTRPATASIHYEDHHGSHDLPMCAEHATRYAPNGLPKGFVR